MEQRCRSKPRGQTFLLFLSPPGLILGTMLGGCALKTIWYVKTSNFHRFKSFPQLTHKNNSKIHFELQACHSSLVVLSFWRHTPKFPIFSRSCHQIGFKLQFDGKSVTGRTDGRTETETDGRTNIKNLERPYTKSPFGAINWIEQIFSRLIEIHRKLPTSFRDCYLYFWVRFLFFEFCQLHSNFCVIQPCDFHKKTPELKRSRRELFKNI